MPSAILLAPIILLAYYLIAWVLVGREPKPAAIVARYNPPEGVSPAGARYVFKQRSDDKSLAAALAHMAARRVITITPADGKYEIRLVRGGKMPEAHDEQRVLELLFADTDVAVIDPAQPGHYSAAVAAILKAVQEQFSGVLFRRNGWWIAAGVVTNFIWILGTWLATPKWGFEALFISVWLFLFGGIFASVFAVAVVPAIRDTLRGRSGATGVTRTVLPVLGIMAFLLVPLNMVAKYSSLDFAVALVAMMAIHGFSGSLLKTFTPDGRKLRDEVMGYRQFLMSVEADELNRMNAPDSAPQFINDAMAYAIALEVKEAWGDHLATALYGNTVALG